MNVFVTKEFVFDASHMLANHMGLCKNVHGHTYKVEVTVTKKVDDMNAGMVIDFKELKETLNKHLFDKLDHAFIYDSLTDSPIETRVVDTLKELRLKTYGMPMEPTAEGMCIHFAKVISSLFIIQLVKVKVWETPTSFAEVVL